MRRSQVLVGAAALVLVAGAGVALVDGGTAPSRKANYSAAFGAPAVARDAAGAAAGGAGGGAASTDALAAEGNVARPAALVPGGPRVVKTASLTVSVTKAASVANAARQANTIAERHGGFVSSTDTQTGAHASSTLTLRVPVAAYDAALGELRSLGSVSNESLGGQDVSNTLVDLDARLRSLRAQESALNALMAKANTVGETLQVAQAVAEVRTQIEQLAGQQKNLTDQADLATITVAVVGPGGVVGEPKSDPLLVSAVEKAMGATLEVLGGAIVVVGYALPAGALAGLGYGLWRLANRRRVAAAA